MAAGGAARGLWGRLAESRVGRWWRALARDYVSSVLETSREIRAHPLRAGGWLVALGGALVAISSLPDSQSFETASLEAAGILLLLSPGTRSPGTDRHVQRLLRLRASGRLSYRSLLFLAVVYEAPHPPQAALYSALCPFLTPPLWRDLPARLLDVGFGGRWWVLGTRLKDCDVNEEEFGGLPPNLRRLDPQNLHSHRNEELFLEKFRPVFLTPEEIRGEEGEGEA